MFLELNVQVYSSFGRTDTTWFKCCLRASMLKCFACCHCSASRTLPHFVVLHLKSGSLENQDIEFGLRYVQNIVKLKVFLEFKGKVTHYSKRKACDQSYLSHLPLTSITLGLLCYYRWSMYRRKNAHSKLAFFKPGFEVCSWKSRKISLETYLLEVFRAHRRVILSASNALVSLR